MYICTICSQFFNVIPDDAIELTSPTRGRATSHFVRFADGSHHNLKSDRYHMNHHVLMGRIKKDCKFCELEGRRKAEVVLAQNQLEPAPEPPQVVQEVPEELLPQSDPKVTSVEEVPPTPVVPEEDSLGVTSMQAAFARLFKKSQQEEEFRWKSDSTELF
jgi:hypothetical protein